jgi:hypothetical protein
MNFFGAANFDIRKHYRHGKSGVVAPSEGGRNARNTYWIVNRSLLRLKFVALNGVPERKIPEALRLETLSWVPFATSDYYAEVMTSIDGSAPCACITAWDRDSVEIAQTAQGINLLETNQLLKVIPENALQTGIDNGLRLLGDNDDGLEVQVWERGILRHSRWWPTPPDAAQWQNFQRSAGFESSNRVEQLPAVSKPVWRIKPNGFTLAQSADGASSGISTAEALGVAVAAFLLVVPTIWVANSWWTLRRAADAESVRATAAQQQVSGLLDARNLALEQAGQAATLHGLFMAPDVSTILTEIAERFNETAKNGTFQIQEFEVRDAKLRLVVAVIAPPSATSVIKAFEFGDRLKNVQIAVESNRWIITANVMPLSNIAPAKLAAATLVAPTATKGATTSTATPNSPSAIRK